MVMDVGCNQVLSVTQYSLQWLSTTVCTLSCANCTTVPNLSTKTPEWVMTQTHGLFFIHIHVYPSSPWSIKQVKTSLTFVYNTQYCTVHCTVVQYCVTHKTTFWVLLIVLTDVTVTHQTPPQSRRMSSMKIL